MSDTVLNILVFASLPAFAAIAGATVAVLRPPGSKLRSILQHFAAGVVFSVVAVELLPDIMHEHNAVATAVGFALGVVTMLGIKKLTSVGEKTTDGVSDETATFSQAMLFAIGVDILIDGFLVGIGFSAGQKEGKLLTLALAMELLSLGLALACTMGQANISRGRIVATVAGLASLIIIGAGLGSTILQALSKEALEVVLSFGLAALLYLVTEELLVEAHEEPETPLITSTFFAGFLLFLILGIVA